MFRKKESKNEWVSKTFLETFIENPRGSKNEWVSKKNPEHPPFLLRAYWGPAPPDFGISCPGEGDQKNEWLAKTFIENSPSLLPKGVNIGECSGCYNTPEMKFVKNLRSNLARKLWKYSSEKMHRNCYRSSAEEDGKNDVVVKMFLKILRSYPLDLKSFVCRRKG